MAWSDPASEKQSALIKRLFTQAQAAMEDADEALITAVTGEVAPVQDILVSVMAGQEIDKRAASIAIDALFAADRLVSAASAPARLRNHERVIPNRFAKACGSCGTNVEADAGYAALYRGTWSTWCKPCATETDEARAAREQAEREQRFAAAKAEQAAQQAEREARLAAHRALQAKGGEMVAFATDLFARTGTDTRKIPEVRVAIPSATGHNDLDFFRVRFDGRRFNTPTVVRVIGGGQDVRLAAPQAHDVLERLVFLDAHEAMLTFGRELGHCGHCGRTLTDEASRAAGIGPVCAGRI